MRGPRNIDDVIADVLAEAKTASVHPSPTPTSSVAEGLRKLGSALRLSASGSTTNPDYADLYTVKEAFYGR